MSNPSPPSFESVFPNLVNLGFVCILAGFGAQVAVAAMQLVVPTETTEAKQLFRIATAVAGMAVGATAAWVAARRQIARGELRRSASPWAIAACVAAAFLLGALAGPWLHPYSNPRKTAEGAVTTTVTAILIPFALWWGLRLRRKGVVDAAMPAGALVSDPRFAVDPTQFASPAAAAPLSSEQRDMVVRTLAGLDATAAQFARLRSDADVRTQREHANAVIAASNACASEYEPLLPDEVVAKLYESGARTGARAPLPLGHPVLGGLAAACAGYSEAARVLSIACEDPARGREYARMTAAKLGTVGDDPVQVADAAAREARRQRNLAADAAGLPQRY